VKSAALGSLGQATVLTGVVVLTVMTMLRAVDTRPTRVAARIAAAVSAPLFVAALGVVAIRFLALSY
jgi:hypothetical protein